MSLRNWCPPIAGVATLVPAALACLLVAAPPAAAAWFMHAGNAQHTALSTVPTQPLERIHWQTPVDLNPQYSGTTLFIHYGSPLVTEGNTVILPVKAGVADTFRVEARRGSDGGLLWQLDTDFRLAPAGWTPSMGPALARAGRVYFPGGGGTLLWTAALDAPGPHTATRVAFYGIANYGADPAAFNASLRVCTPLTSDSHGTVYFGVRAVAANPLGIESGVAAVDASGGGRFVPILAASGGLCDRVGMNCAPALSRDEQTLYVAANGAGGSTGYLLALATADLSTRHVRALIDPVSLGQAQVFTTGTSTPMVAPDDRVYYGALESPFGSNAVRGWMLQFDAALNPAGPPGAFGWDDTPSVVPAASVPAYAGPSSYLLMTKYNFYTGIGDGTNRIAILDPLATQIDAFSGATVMKEIYTILGPTPDSEADPSFPNAVREWCINTALVDPFKHSVLAGSEDGRLYRWDLNTNSFSEAITLTPGVGEAYTPTLAGPDGQVYAINNATLFAVGATNAGVEPPAPAAQLAPPRPNPFTRSTSLRFQLADESAVSLEILDLAGRRVVVLAEGTLPEGEHVARWDGRDAGGAERAPGVYLARLRVGGRVELRRLVRVR